LRQTALNSIFIAGKPKKWRGALVVDMARLRRLVKQSRDAVVRRGGFAPNLLG
jgi:hypothetical protein